MTKNNASTVPISRPTNTQLPIRLLTHNIRYATTTPSPGEQLWPFRLPLLLCQLNFVTRHIPNSILCLQEVLHKQLIDILHGLNHSLPSTLPPPPPPPSPATNEDQWTFVGVARDDGHKIGEYSPILYQPAIWSLQHSKTIWLSPTPSVPSKGWDAASVRIVTIAVLLHRFTGVRVVVCNTHLDDQGSVARRKAAQMIRALVGTLGREWNAPVVLSGDFNSEVGEGAYRVITSPGSVSDSGGEDEMGRSEGMKDVGLLVKMGERYGEWDTFTGFPGDEEEKKRIDFVFIDKEERWNVDGYAVLDNVFDEGIFVSDHRAVVADLTVVG